MSSTSSHPTSRAYERSTRGLVVSGTTAFAGVMLATVAVYQIFEGIVAIAKDDVFVTGLNYTFEFDITTWGWIHLVIGILALAVGLGILAGQTWGILGGIVLAFVGALSNFAFLPYYPFWSIVVIAFNVFVIWALCNELARG